MLLLARFQYYLIGERGLPRRQRAYAQRAARFLGACVPDGAWRICARLTSPVRYWRSPPRFGPGSAQLLWRRCVRSCGL